MALGLGRSKVREKSLTKIEVIDGLYAKQFFDVAKLLSKEVEGFVLASRDSKNGIV